MDPDPVLLLLPALQEAGEDPAPVQRWLEMLDDQDRAWVLVLLALFALAEYLFPPFPGDVLMVAGAFTVKAKGWPLLHAWLASLAGSLLGGILQFAAGRWIRRYARARPTSRAGRIWERLEPLRARLDRHGAAVILGSRFLPVLRGPLMVAAGTTPLRLPEAGLAMLCGIAAWNSLMYLVGALAGGNPEAIDRFLTRYTKAIAALVVLGLAVWWWLRRRAARRRRTGAPGTRPERGAAPR